MPADFNALLKTLFLRIADCCVVVPDRFFARFVLQALLFIRTQVYECVVSFINILIFICHGLKVLHSLPTITILPLSA